MSNLARWKIVPIVDEKRVYCLTNHGIVKVEHLVIIRKEIAAGSPSSDF